MKDERHESIDVLIERSSLGAAEARRMRATVSRSTGRTIARSATSGRFVATNAKVRRNSKG